MKIINYFRNTLLLCFFSICTFILYVVLLFPMGYFSNWLSFEKFFLGNFFVRFHGEITLFSMCFLSGFILKRFDFYRFDRAVFYSLLLTLLVVYMTKSIVVVETSMSFLHSFLIYIVPFLAVMSSWFLGKKITNQSK